MIKLSAKVMLKKYGIETNVTGIPYLIFHVRMTMMT